MLLLKNKINSLFDTDAQASCISNSHYINFVVKPKINTKAYRVVTVADGSDLGPL